MVRLMFSIPVRMALGPCGDQDYQLLLRIMFHSKLTEASNQNQSIRLESQTRSQRSTWMDRSSGHHVRDDLVEVVRLADGARLFEAGVHQLEGPP